MPLENFASRVLIVASKFEKATRKDPNSSIVKEQVCKVYKSTRLCSMATVDESGKPHINTAFFCYSKDLTIFFLSEPSAKHSENITRDGNIVLTIVPEGQDWGDDLIGIQLFGSCKIANGKSEEAARSEYTRRFPAFNKWFKELSQEEKDEFSSKFYVIKPKKIVILDEAKFGEENFIILKP